jgi:hypothetical protein
MDWIAVIIGCILAYWGAKHLESHQMPSAVVLFVIAGVFIIVAIADWLRPNRQLNEDEKADQDTDD